jgi:hypothetical protein
MIMDEAIDHVGQAAAFRLLNATATDRGNYALNHIRPSATPG